MANNFTPPASFTYNGKKYIYHRQSNRNKKNELMSEICFYYKIENKGEELPFVKSQIIWMQETTQTFA
jgi:hypothetical protein